MNWKNIIITSLITFALIYILAWFMIIDSGTICQHYDQCFYLLKDGIARPIINIVPYLFGSLAFLLLVSKRLQRNGFITVMITTIVVCLLTFSEPILSTGWIGMGGRAFGSLLSRPLYPIFLIPVLFISYLYFKRQDNKNKKQNEKKK